MTNERVRKFVELHLQPFVELCNGRLSIFYFELVACRKLCLQSAHFLNQKFFLHLGLLGLILHKGGPICKVFDTRVFVYIFIYIPVYMDAILFGAPPAAIMITATSRQSRTSTFLSACRCNHAPLSPPNIESKLI